jgi:ATP-dependent Lon protease
VELTLLRLVPLVEEGYHLVELGPRGTGKSYLYEELAPRARLLSGGKASVSKLFLDTRSVEKGLVADQDAIAFDEISSTDFRGDEVVSALKTYMASGKVSRGKATVQGRASVVLLGNIDAPGKLLKESHLLAPLPGRLREDTALMDRICGYLPGWEMPKIGPGSLADGVGLTTSFLAECLSRLRRRSLTAQIEGWAPKESPFLRGNLQKRDWDAALQTASGLLKLIYPGLAIAGGDTPIGDVQWPVLRWALWMGLEARLRVREQ